MKTICIYHSIDLDGWMSAAIIKHWWNTTPEMKSIDDRIEFIGYNYEQPIPNLSEYDKIIMCDISFPKEEMFKLFERLDTNFIWIDHHVSAIKDNGELDENNIKDISTLYNGLRRTDFASCELTWLYFFPNKTIPEIVRLLGRYDCFGHKGTSEDQKVLEFQYGARYFIKDDEDAYNWLLRCISDHNKDTEFILSTGIGIYGYLCMDAKHVYNNRVDINFEKPTTKNEKGNTVYSDYKFCGINRERFNPDNFGIDYHKDGYEGVASFHYANNKWHFSLYNANGLVDCSEIAKRYGGGGHKGAAGFKCSTLHEFYM